MEIQRHEPVTATLSTQEKSLVGLFLILKLAILILLPLTGDEAYFISWAEDLSLGYYDHPPVIGWLIYLLSFISKDYYFYRLIAFSSVLFVSYLLYGMVKQSKGKQVALLVALIFLLSPLSLLSVILVNDVTLLVFGLLGFIYFSRALESDSYQHAVIAGVFLGLSFLSKYLSAPLFIGLIIYLLVNRKKVNWTLVAVGLFIVSLFVFENLYFNYLNCWNNIVFNLYSRTEGGGFNAGYLALFLLTFFVVIPPQGVFRLIKAMPLVLNDTAKQIVYVTSCFLIVFTLVSTFKRIGLHWLYLPTIFTYLLFQFLPVERLRSLMKYNALLSLVFAIALIFIMTQAETLFADHKNYREALIYTQTQTICKNLSEGETIYSLSYSKNSVLAYHCRNNRFHVISNTAKYGREDDKRVNFSQIDGETLWVLITDLGDVKKIDDYFLSNRIHRIRMNDKVDYYLVEARGFQYEAYKKKVIQKIAGRYYSPPDWLPLGSCKFTQKYKL